MTATVAVDRASCEPTVASQPNDNRKTVRVGFEAGASTSQNREALTAR